MQTDLQISWEHLDPSEFVQKRIEREVASLEHMFGRIISCKVVIEGPSHHQHKGGLFALRARLVLPGGKEISASRNPGQDHSHEDAYVTIRDVFQALKRQLRESVRKRREEGQHPDSQLHGIIARVFPDKDYGFIRADDGREIYFHKNAVLDEDFSHLRPGVEAHFAEEEGENGPQASTLRAYGLGKRPA